MLSKKKKIFVLVGMVALLVATGVLNVVLNNKSQAAAVGETVTYASFFDAHRAERATTRSETMLYLDAIIANEATSAQAKTDAETQKLELTSAMETELVLESLIKGLGFEDAVVTNTTNNLNVIVRCENLTQDQATQILDVIVRETDKTASGVRIIPIS